MHHKKNYWSRILCLALNLGGGGGGGGKQQIFSFLATEPIGLIGSIILISEDPMMIVEKRKK